MVDVVCAIILCEKRVFVTQRSEHMNLPLKWEFPGGKVNGDETEEQGLLRELKEELNISVRIIDKMNNNIHCYEQFTINLIPYVVEYIDGNINLIEHKDGQWLEKQDLRSLDWAAADIPILNQLLNSKYV